MSKFNRGTLLDAVRAVSGDNVLFVPRSEKEKAWVLEQLNKLKKKRRITKIDYDIEAEEEQDYSCSNIPEGYDENNL
jgi:hypothetical protein